MEKKGKFRLPRFLNFFDIALLAVAALIALVLVIGNLVSGGGGKDITVRYTVEVTGFQDGNEKLIVPGDTLIDVVKKYDIGKIVGVECEPTTWDVVDYESLRVIHAPVPGQVTALVSVECDGEDYEDKIVIGEGYEVRIGQVVSVRTPKVTFSGTVVEIDGGER